MAGATGGQGLHHDPHRWCQQGSLGAASISATMSGTISDAVAENRARLSAELRLPEEPRWLDQVHGTRVCMPSAGNALPADACFEDRPGRVCAVLTADCLPVLFCNLAGTRVAAAHAGWRGLLAGVLEQTAAAFDDSPDQIMAWLGPAIGPAAFEVGDEVRIAFLAEDPASGPRFRGPWGGSLVGRSVRTGARPARHESVSDLSAVVVCAPSVIPRAFSPTAATALPAEWPA